MNVFSDCKIVKSSVRSHRFPIMIILATEKEEEYNYAITQTCVSQAASGHEDRINPTTYLREGAPSFTIILESYAAFRSLCFRTYSIAIRIMHFTSSILSCIKPLRKRSLSIKNTLSFSWVIE